MACSGIEISGLAEEDETSETLLAMEAPVFARDRADVIDASMGGGGTESTRTWHRANTSWR